MREPRRFTDGGGVLALVFAMVAVLAAAVGIFGADAFGVDTKNPITLNMPRCASPTAQSAMEHAFRARERAAVKSHSMSHAVTVAAENGR